VGKPRIFQRALVSALLGAPFLTGCASTKPNAYRAEVARAERAASAGRKLEAAEAYHQAAEKTDRPLDKNYARYAEARHLESAGKQTEARSILRGLAVLSPPSEYSPMAAFRAAMMIRREQPETCQRELEAVVLGFPDNGASRSALREYLQIEADGSRDPSAWLSKVATQKPKTAIEQVALWERARLLDQAEKQDQALGEYVLIARTFPYPKGLFRDDALFRASEIEEAGGRFEQAIAYLQELLKDREHSHLVGTYERPKFSKAAVRIARLFERQKKLTEARDAWHRVYADYRTSIERDDALWQESRLSRALGDAGESCSALSRLVREFPESRYAACAGQLCPKLEPAKAGICHDYVLRSVQEPQVNPSE
jgi:tetratricopeptide (TPR) repeat protein